jgi:Tol biopolymer transport system component
VRLTTALLCALAAFAQSRPPVTSHIVVADRDGRNERVVYSSPALFEAPNWSPDGKYLLLNSQGRLWKLVVAGGEPQPVDTGAVNNINNDHGISADGKWLAISAGQMIPRSSCEPSTAATMIRASPMP